MLVSDGKITMSDAEWREFAAATFAPWMPRTPAEFDAMCALGSARHVAENTAGCGFMHAMAAEAMAFGADGEVNFPIDSRRLAHAKVHGTWPSDDELKAYASQETPTRPGLSRVK